MTVSELIALLQKVDPSKDVKSDGCDCTDNAIAVHEYSDEVLIARRKELYGPGRAIMPDGQEAVE